MAKTESGMDGILAEADSRTNVTNTPDRDDETNQVIPGTALSGPTAEGVRELITQTSLSLDVNATRLKTAETTVEGQQGRVQFAATNNYFKNVSENKDVSKLVSLLATCINASRKVVLHSSNFI